MTTTTMCVLVLREKMKVKRLSGNFEETKRREYWLGSWRERIEDERVQWVKVDELILTDDLEENELAGLSELCYDTRDKVIWEREERKEEETTTNNREFSPQELEKLQYSEKMMCRGEISRKCLIPFCFRDEKIEREWCWMSEWIWRREERWLERNE